MAETIRCKNIFVEIIPLGCIGIKDLVREKEMEMEKLEDLTIRDR